MLTIDDFQIGDRVRVIAYDGPRFRQEQFNGQTGFVVAKDSQNIFVDHDKRCSPDLDSCDGLVASGRGWPYYPRELEFVNYPTEGVVINDLL